MNADCSRSGRCAADEGRRCSIVKSARIGDVVAGVFAQECVVRLDAGFPLASTSVGNHHGLEVALAKSVVLEGFD